MTKARIGAAAYIAEAIAKGETYKVIGLKLDVSKQRIQQIAKKHGLRSTRRTRLRSRDGRFL
jgi:hypothetical protein